VEVRSETGLHARPAAAFVRMASVYEARIRLENLSMGRPAVDARSITGILSSGVEKGHFVRIVAEGPDEVQAATALGELLQAFGESVEEWD
jgi:phosphotransferase system HPr (HPr) family protein